MKGEKKKQGTALKKREGLGCRDTSVLKQRRGVYGFLAWKGRWGSAADIRSSMWGAPAYRSHAQVYLKRIGNALDLSDPPSHEDEQTQAQ